MARDRQRPRETPAKLEQNRQMWNIFGRKARLTVASWDPKAERVIAALLEVVASGATVVLRPGSGGGSLGIAIWEGDNRYPPEWCATEDDLNEWAQEVLDARDVKGQQAAD